MFVGEYRDHSWRPSPVDVASAAASSVAHAERADYFTASPTPGQSQASLPQPGQPLPYLRLTASARSTPATFAIVRQPRDHVGELAESFFVRAIAQRGSQLAYLFHEPHERPVDAAGDVLLVVHVLDEELKVVEGDGGWFCH